MATVPPPSPRPPKAHRDGGDAPVSLFVHTDLDTRLGLFVAPDTTMRALKLLVGAEHTAIFPDLGPVAVKSFQVRRLGALYHLSDSMTVTSACTKIKGAYFLHVKMTEASAATRCCQDEGRRLSAGQIGNYVEKHVPELPAKTSEIACDVLPRMLEGGDAAAELNDVQAHDALPSLTQLNTEMKKNEAVGLASDTEAGSDPVIEKAKSYSSQIKQANQTEGAYISSTSMENAGKPSNQSDTSHDVEKVHARKEDILHDDEDRDVGGGVSDNIEVRIQEQMLEEIHAMDNFTQEKEHKKSRTDSFEMSAPDPPRIANESDVGDLTKSSGAPLEAGTTSQREPLNTSFRQEVQDTLHQDTTEDTSTVAKKKKKKRELAPSKAAGQETSEPSAGAKELSKSTGDVCNVELTGRDDIAVKSSGLTLPSSGFDDVNHGGKLVQVMSDAQASSNLISEQGKFDHALKGCRNPSIGDAINSAGEVVASEGGNPKGSISRNGGEKHEQVKQSGEGSHDEGVAEISNMEKDGKSTDASEKRQTNDDASQLKRRKKAKKASSVDLASVDTTHEKEMHGYREHATGTDTVYTEREIVHDPSMHHSTDNVHQGDSYVTENPNGDGKKKKRRRRQHSKGVDPNQDLIKSSESVTTENSMHFRGGAALDAKQAIPDGIEGATVINNKELGENLAANNLIDEVLADLRSKDSSSKILDEDITGQTHQGSNKKALELPESTVDNVGVTAAALPPKYPAPVHSDAPANSPRLKKPKGKKLKIHSSSVPEEDANRELSESVSLRFSDKTSDPKDILTGDVAAQADDKPKPTKRRRKKVSLTQVPADNGETVDEQVSQVDIDLKGVNVTQANLVQGDSVVDAPLSTVGKVEQKSMSSKIRATKVQETHCSTPGLDNHLAKDSQSEYVTDTIGSHSNKNAAGTATEMPGVQKGVMALKSAIPNSQKPKKRSSNSEFQSLDSALEHDSCADLGNLRSEKSLVSPKNSADAAEPNYVSVVRPASDAINFIDHFGSSKMDDTSVSAEHKQNNEDETLREVKNKKKNKRKQATGSIEPNDVSESLLPTDKTSLIGHLGTSKAIVPFVVENMNSEDENGKNGKEKKRRRKTNMEMPIAEKESPNFENQGTDKTNMEDATLEKKLDKNGVDNQNKLLTDEDHAHLSKDVRKSTSKIKPPVKSKNESIKGRVASNPKPVRNLVKDFSTSPLVSSDSTEGTPQNANRYRVAIRKVPSKRYEQTSEKSKKENRKVGSGAIFNDANSEGSDDELDTKKDKSVMEASPDTSAASGDSGISSAADDESDPDDDGNMSLSQKSLRGGMDIGSILRGSNSYKKAKKRELELLDDDTHVPDSQPTDDHWDWTETDPHKKH